MKKRVDYSEIKLDHRKPDLLFLQLEEELRRLFRNITVKADLRLPSTRELAQHLGIDRKTVARAYHSLLEKGFIERKSPKILQIAKSLPRKQLAPYPNIGIILPYRFSELIEHNSGISLQFIKGIIDSAAEKRLSTIMLELPPASAPPDEIEEFNGSLLKRLLGIVHIGGRDCFPDRPLEAVMKNEALPQVLISAYPDIPNVGAVVCDPSSGGRTLAEQLRAMRHRKVGLLIYNSSLESTGTDGYFSYASYRRAGIIRNILMEYGLDCDEKYCSYGCTSYHTVFNALKKKKTAGNLPTVFWCHNDEVARWCIKALNQLGLSVPQDISVVGFDGTAAAKEDDNLTTIALPFYAIGHRAVLQLLEYYEHGINDTNRTVYLQTFLISKGTLSYANHSKCK